MEAGGERPTRLPEIREPEDVVMARVAQPGSEAVTQALNDSAFQIAAKAILKVDISKGTEAQVEIIGNALQSGSVLLVRYVRFGGAVYEARHAVFARLKVGVLMVKVKTQHYDLSNSLDSTC